MACNFYKNCFSWLILVWETRFSVRILILATVLQINILSIEYQKLSYWKFTDNDFLCFNLRFVYALLFLKYFYNPHNIKLQLLLARTELLNSLFIMWQIPYNVPTVVCEYLSIPPTLISSFQREYILVKSLTIFVT